MPQQPKITGDVEVDSWALQVTQELNDTTGAGGGGGGDTLVATGTELPEVTTGTIGELFSLQNTDEDYGPDVYRRIANNGELADWDLVGRAEAPSPVFFPQPVTATEPVIYRMGFTAGSTTIPGRGTVVGYTSGPTFVGYVYGTNTFDGGAVTIGTPADTSDSRYTGVTDPQIDPGDAVDFSGINVSLPTGADWDNVRGATAGTAINNGWAFWTGDGGAGNGTQFGFRIPHPALINAANPLRTGAWPDQFPYVPIASTAGSIRLTVQGIDDPTYTFVIGYTPSTALPWTTYNSDNFSGHVFASSRSRSAVVTGSGNAGGFSPNPAGGTFRPLVVGHRYDVLVQVNSTLDAAGFGFTAPTIPDVRTGTFTFTPPGGVGFTVNSGTWYRTGDLVYINGTFRPEPNTSLSALRPVLAGLPFSVSLPAVVNLDSDFVIDRGAVPAVGVTARLINVGDDVRLDVFANGTGVKSVLQYEGVSNNPIRISATYRTGDP